MLTKINGNRHTNTTNPTNTAITGLLDLLHQIAEIGTRCEGADSLYPRECYHRLALIQSGSCIIYNYRIPENCKKFRDFSIFQIIILEEFHWNFRHGRTLLHL
jgi:hypothetical protein